MVDLTSNTEIETMKTETVRVDENGDRYYFQDDKRHRTDGPAIELANGTKIYIQNGKRHRADGPAVDYPNGRISWWLHGDNYTLDGFLKRTTISPEDKFMLKLIYG